MTEQIIENLIGRNWDIVMHCVMRAITEHASKVVGDGGDLAKVPGWENFYKDKKLAITFQVNGVDLPFIETLESLYKNIDEDVAEKAASLMEDELTDIMKFATEGSEKIQDLLDEMHTALLVCARKKLGLKIRELEDES